MPAPSCNLLNSAEGIMKVRIPLPLFLDCSLREKSLLPMYNIYRLLPKINGFDEMRVNNTLLSFSLTVDSLVMAFCWAGAVKQQKHVMAKHHSKAAIFFIKFLFIQK